MLDFAQRFAAADPATTPPDAPLPDEALALLDRVMTPRTPQTAGRQPAVPRPPRWQLPKLAITIVIPALILATLVAMGWNWFGLIGQSAAEASQAPSVAPSPIWPEITSERELVEAADAILVADTIGMEYIEVGDAPYRLATVRVVSTGKGDFTAGEYLQVAFPAWDDDGASDMLAGGGTRVLLFLTTPGVANAHADLVNPPAQGSYEVVDDETLIPGPWNPLELDPDFLKRMGIRIP